MEFFLYWVDVNMWTHLYDVMYVRVWLAQLAALEPFYYHCHHLAEICFHVCHFLKNLG
jgi:hypothetical protein